MRTFLFIFFVVSVCHFSNAQNITTSIRDFDALTIDRFDVLRGQDILHTSIKPYRRDDLVRVALTIPRDSISSIDGFNIQHIFDQNNEFDYLLSSADGIESAQTEKVFTDSSKTFYTYQTVEGEAQVDFYRQSRKPILKHFYKTPAHLFEVNTDHFYLKVNPIIHAGFGISQDEESNLYLNRRGLSLRGAIDQKIYFFTEILETQARYPNYVNTFVDDFRAFPGAGLYKRYDLEALNVSRGQDYLISNAYIGFDISKHVGLQFGHGSNFIGDGYRSLLLSDFSAPYFYLKFNTRVWKFHYQNIFAELAAAGVRDDRGDQRLPRKYMAAHYLNFNIRDNLSIGIYEAVIFDKREGGLELQYLNPIIFYRTVEGMIGSPDNALLGLTAKWNLWNKLQLYGQFLLDDISISEILDGNLGWWGNKFGFQAGVKYYNAFDIDQLDIQVEVNQMRPYTYSHRDSVTTYSNLNQPLAHPLGANFTETMLMVRYRPIPKLQLEGRVFLINTGEGNDTLNVGSNVLLANTSRFGQYGMFIGQGAATDINFLRLNASYQLKHNMFLELEMGRRKKTSTNAARNLDTTYFTAGVRWNIARRDWFF